MAFASGRNAAFYLADSAGTQRNLTPFLDGVDWSHDQDMNETSVFGTVARTYVSGQSSATISLSGKWDTAGTASPDNWLNGLYGGTVTAAFVYAPAGSAATFPYRSGAAWVTNYSVSSPYDNVVTFSATLQVTSTVTRGTF